MRSISRRILSLTLMVAILSNFILIIIGMIDMTQAVDSDSVQLITEVSEKYSEEIDSQLLSVEQTVGILKDYIEGQINENPTLWRDEEDTREHMAKVYELAEIVMKNTNGSKSVYYHPVEETGRSNNGIYLVKTSSGKYEDAKSQLGEYSEGDDNAAWYYEPLKSRKAMWIKPYTDTRVGGRIISYVAPICHKSTIFAIVGIDIDMSILQDLVKKIQFNSTGYGVLLDPNGDIVYHRDFPEGVTFEEYSRDYSRASREILLAMSSKHIRTYNWNDGKRRILFADLRNGMHLGITVCTKEIKRPAHIFIVLSLISFIAVLVMTYFLAGRVSRVIVRPLQDLTNIAQRLAEGDLNVSIHCDTNDEVEVLARSMQKTADELRKYVDNVNKIARTDSLTGVWNKTAYAEKIAKLKVEILKQSADFSVAVLDVNYLKHMNDTYGHEAGDYWIAASAAAIKNAFGKSRVYRIGGDEFAVILGKNERQHCENMLRSFYSEISHFNQSEKKEYVETLQIAVGIADYDPKNDTEYNDVFTRADSAMYENKKQIKGLLAGQMETDDRRLILPKPEAVAKTEGKSEAGHKKISEQKQPAPRSAKAVASEEDRLEQLLKSMM